jgi:hypothetical protein
VIPRDRFVAIAIARSARPPEVKAIAPDVGVGHARPAIPGLRISEPMRLIRDESGHAAAPRPRD